MNEESFQTHYQGLTDDQLLQILADKADLVPEAAAALDSEIRKRKLQPLEPQRWFRQAGSIEQVQSLGDYCDYRQLSQRRKTVGRYWYFLAMGPFVAGLVLGGKTFDNSVVFIPLTLAWAMCVAVYCLYISSRFLAFRCPQCNERFGRGSECFSCGFPRGVTEDRK